MNVVLQSPALPMVRERITTVGLAQLARLAYENADIEPLWTALVNRVSVDPTDAAALMDLSTMLILSGQREEGLDLQAEAVRLCPLYRRPHGSADGLRVLAFVVEGDMMANTPLDFLLEGSDIELHLLYVGSGQTLPDHVPDHDVAFLAVGESHANQAILTKLEATLAGWPRPVMNGSPGRISALTRDGVCAMFHGDKHVLAPRTVRVERRRLAQLGRRELRIEALLSDSSFPIIARPLDSHAGTGLSKLDSELEVAAYLREREDEIFYIAPFVDYRSADGLHRKQRIAFVHGRPFISHMAISEHWMVHYLSAGMAENSEKRAEEARFMESFESHFVARNQPALQSLCRVIGLDYFSIDCAELPDGRLLLFEADVAMIVHALDSEGLFPYKKPAMERLFKAFEAGLSLTAQQDMVRAKSQRAPSVRR